MTKLIVVFGATGNQGGSVVKAILSDPALSKEYKIRGITRDPSKPAARKLADQGVEVTSADLGSKSAVLAALKGADTVFLVTNFWETGSRDVEVSQGKTVADAAKNAGVRHFIFSSLENIEETSGGKFKHLAHFDGKNDIEKYIRSSGIPTTTFVLPGFYVTNLGDMMFQKGDDGNYTWNAPFSDKAQLTLFDTSSDLGKFVKPALKLPASEVNGLRILAAADYYTPSRIVSEFEETTGKKLKFTTLPADVYKGFLPPPHQDELLETFLLLEAPGYYYGGKSLEESHKLLDEKPTSWIEFIKKQKKWME